jgi:spore germination cell wall hydrolase CwlJ-like protein
MPKIAESEPASEPTVTPEPTPTPTATPELTVAPEPETYAPNPLPTPEPTPAPTPEPYSEKEKKYIARVVYAESQGESMEGKIAVACVVLNRYESGRFGKTIRRVVFAKHQFAVAGTYNAECMEAVEAAVSDNPYPDNMFYFKRADRKYWGDDKSIKRYCRIGAHTFYTVGEPEGGKI